MTTGNANSLLLNKLSTHVNGRLFRLNIMPELIHVVDIDAFHVPDANNEVEKSD